MSVCHHWEQEKITSIDGLVGAYVGTVILFIIVGRFNPFFTILSSSILLSGGPDLCHTEKS